MFVQHLIMLNNFSKQPFEKNVQNNLHLEMKNSENLFFFGVFKNSAITLGCHITFTFIKQFWSFEAYKVFFSW